MSIKRKTAHTAEHIKTGIIKGRTRMENAYAQGFPKRIVFAENRKRQQGACCLGNKGNKQYLSGKLVYAAKIFGIE
jgi:hypothetical protein